MLKLIQVGNSLPISYPVDPSSTFEPGQIGQLKLMGNDVVIGLSDGTAPIGIIDDVRTAAFSQPAIDEVVLISAAGILDAYGRYVSVADAKSELNNSRIIASSFVSDTESLVLNPINGVITAPAGTTLNFDIDGDGVPDSIKVIVSYVYEVTSLPGDDTTIGSNRLTLWFGRGIYSTDQFETKQRYPLNAALFVSENGKLTTKQVDASYPPVAMVLGPPSTLVNTLEFLWV